MGHRVTSLLDARVKLAAAISVDAEDDLEFDVHDNVREAIVTPAAVIGWRTPMIAPDLRTACNGTAFLFVDLIVNRANLDSAVEDIESMYQLVQSRLRANTDDQWRVTGDSGIVEFDVGNVKYLACRLEIAVTITL